MFPTKNKEFFPCNEVPRFKNFKKVLLIAVHLRFQTQYFQRYAFDVFHQSCNPKPKSIGRLEDSTNVYFPSRIKFLAQKFQNVSLLTFHLDFPNSVSGKVQSSIFPSSLVKRKKQPFVKNFLELAFCIGFRWDRKIEIVSNILTTFGFQGQFYPKLLDWVTTSFRQTTHSWGWKFHGVCSHAWILLSGKIPIRNWSFQFSVDFSTSVSPKLTIDFFPGSLNLNIFLSDMLIGLKICDLVFCIRVQLVAEVLNTPTRKRWNFFSAFKPNYLLKTGVIDSIKTSVSKKKLD